MSVEKNCKLFVNSLFWFYFMDCIKLISMQGFYWPWNCFRGKHVSRVKIWVALLWTFCTAFIMCGWTKWPAERPVLEF